MKSVADLGDLSGKRVLIRCDFNVPLDADKNITDDGRIRAALPTLTALRGAGARVVIMAHLGRPKGEVNPKYSLAPVAARLGELLGVDVKLAGDVVGESAQAAVASLADGEVALLENVRYEPAEESKDEAARQELAAKYAAFGDLFISDGFGVVHRKQASVYDVAKLLPNAAGYLVAKEVGVLKQLTETPERPYVVVLGGAKVADKLSVIDNLLKVADTLVIGGGMLFTFLKAQGHDVGNSLCELDQLDYARQMIEKAKASGKKLLLPVDNVAADKFDAAAQTQVVGNDIPAGWMALDIGPKTIALYAAAIQGAKTVVWNGPMGCFEMKPFAAGTFGVCEAVAASGATSVIGGGDSVSAVNKSGLAAKMTHISTGGGASLEFLEGKELPGVAALNDK